ncbi:hypothetical protein D3C87_1185280 [compost metagenome]
MLRKGEYYDALELLQDDGYKGEIFYNPPNSYVANYYGTGENINVVSMYQGASNDGYGRDARGRGGYLITRDDPMFDKFKALIVLSVGLRPHHDYHELIITVEEYRGLYEAWRGNKELASGEVS